MADLLDTHVAPKEISKIVGVCLATFYNVWAAKNIGNISSEVSGEWLETCEAR